MAPVRGCVKFFDEEKGFGFITVDEGRDKGQDVFVHASSVKGNPLRDGDEIEGYVEEDDRKRGAKHWVDVTGGTGRRGENSRGGGDRGYGGRSGGKGDSKGDGKGAQQRKPGDWDCRDCGFMNFASRMDCMKCGAQKPREGGRDRSRSRGRDSRRR